MEAVSRDANSVTVRFCRTEFRIARQSLNEVSNGIRIPDADFVARLGGSRMETKHLMRFLRDSVDTSGLEPGMRPGEAIGPEGMTVRLSAADLVLLRNSMVEMTKGEEIEEWEYPIRLGATVAEGKQLLVEVEDLIREMAS